MNIMNNCGNNINASILVFPSTLKGLVPFYLADEILSVDNRISISVAISILLDVYSDETISLRLVKCEGGNKFKGRELKKINLGDISEASVKRKEIVVKSDEQISDEERYRLYYTFSINNISIIGKGRYAVVLVKEAGNNHYVTLATYYFDVIE